MSPEARRAARSEVVQAGDDAVVGAALTGPAMLMGFADSAAQEELGAHWQAVACPEALDRIAQTETALVGKLDAALNAAKAVEVAPHVDSVFTDYLAAMNAQREREAELVAWREALQWQAPT